MGTTSVPRANYCLMKPSSGREHLGSQDQQLKTYIITGHDSLLDNFNITWSGGTVLLAVFATIGIQLLSNFSIILTIKSSHLSFPVNILK